jgi:hypothetical protein
MAIDRIRSRASFAALALAGTLLPYAEGAFKLAWFEVAFVTLIACLLVAPSADATSKGMLLSVTVFCLVLSLGDLALRATVWPRLHFTPTNIYTRRWPPMPLVGRWDENVLYRGTAYGDLAGIGPLDGLREPREVLFQTDEAGFRNTSTKGPFDLVILGDSFAAGAGTSQEKIFSTLLRTQYGRRTYNLSFHAIGPWALYTGNDLDEEPQQIWDISQLPWSSRLTAWRVRYRTFWGRSVVRHWLESLQRRTFRDGDARADELVRSLPQGQRISFLSSSEADARLSRNAVASHPNFPAIVRTMEEMKRLAAQRAIALAVILLPTKGEVYRWLLEEREPSREDGSPSGFAEAILETCDRISLSCFDTKPYLMERARLLLQESGALLWWRDDTHLNDHGHEAVAAFIAEQVLKLRTGAIIANKG